MDMYEQHPHERVRSAQGVRIHDLHRTQVAAARPRQDQIRRGASTVDRASDRSKRGRSGGWRSDRWALNVERGAAQTVMSSGATRRRVSSFGVVATSTYNLLNELTRAGPASSAPRTYEWDAENRFAAINYGGGSQRTEFTYDAFDHCVRIVERSGGASGDVMPQPDVWEVMAGWRTPPPGCHSQGPAQPKPFTNYIPCLLIQPCLSMGR